MKKLFTSFMIACREMTLVQKFFFFLLILSAFTLTLSMKLDILFFPSLQVAGVCMLYFVGEFFLSDYRKKLTVQNAKAAIKATKEWLKKAIKVYFCFWLIIGDIVLMHVLFLVVLLIGTAIINDHVRTEWWTMAQIAFWFTAAHLAISSIIWAIFIETPHRELNEKLFCEVLVVDGKPMKLDDPIWAKGEWFCIQKFDYDYANNIAKFNLHVNSFYGNLTISIPVCVTLYLSEKFNWLELFNVLHEKQEDRSSLSLDEYVAELVQTNEDIDEWVEYYVFDQVSEGVFLSQALELITIPENSFSNVKNASIRLEKPSIFSEKKSKN